MEYCLNMRAALFFAALTSARDLDTQRRYADYYELSVISVLHTMDPKDRKEHRDYFIERSMSKIQRQRREHDRAMLDELVRQSTPPAPLTHEEHRRTAESFMRLAKGAS